MNPCVTYSASIKTFVHTLDSRINLGPIFIAFGIFFQALRPYQRVCKGHLNGYLLPRTCVLQALSLSFLRNFPSPMFIPCPTSILGARVYFCSVAQDYFF